jgi:hypothetical protein
MRLRKRKLMSVRGPRHIGHALHADPVVSCITRCGRSLTFVEEKTRLNAALRSFRMFAAAICLALLGASPVSAQQRPSVTSAPTVRSPATVATRVPGDLSRLANRPATQPVVTRQGMLRVEAPLYNYGKVWDTDTVTHTFEVRNVGSQVVTIANVQTSCGCTTTDQWERQIAPGAVWKLPVKFVAANRRGQSSKTITVDTDDPGWPVITLSLEGEVSPRIEVSPTPGVNFGTLRQDSNARKTLTIVNNGPEPVSLTNPTVDTAFLKVDLRSIEPGRRYELDVETVPPLKVENLRGKIILVSSLREMPEVAINASARVQPRIFLMPKVVMVPQAQEKAQRRRLVVKASEDTTFHIKEAKASDPKITVSVDPVREGKEYQVWLSIPTDFALPATGETITISLDDPGIPVLTARVQAYFAGRSVASGGTATMSATQLVRPGATQPERPLGPEYRPTTPTPPARD